MARKVLFNARIVIVLSLFVCLTGCGRYLIYWDEPYKGRVIDKETDEPVEGAVVAAQYSTIFLLNPGGVVLKKFKCKEVATDEEGSFRIPVMVSARPRFFSYLDEAPFILVFPLGYEKVWTWNPAKKFEQDDKGRFIIYTRRILDKEKLERNLSRCRSDRFSSKACPKLSEIRKKEYYKIGTNLY